MHSSEVSEDFIVTIFVCKLWTGTLHTVLILCCYENSDIVGPPLPSRYKDGGWVFQILP